MKNLRKFRLLFIFLGLVRKENSMKASKWFIAIIFVFCCLGVAFVAWSKVLSLKVDGVDKKQIVQGVITKIEGNKITLKDTSGKILTVGVREESNDKDRKDVAYILRKLKVGDRVRIEHGNLIKIKGFEPSGKTSLELKSK
jgi:hypothetical protein